MKRSIEKDLLLWKDQINRSPLLVRGARQAGKSYIVEEFGNKRFKNCIVINFEFQPELKACFSELDPDKIINKIQLVTGNKIIEGKSLLFLDEIQECPQAIISLRYFKEKKPLLHVIGAGSLLEFALRDEAVRMPVGRIQFLYLEPLSFSEFLEATGHLQLVQFLAEVKFVREIDDIIHAQLLEHVLLYTILGGMPAVVKNYLDNKDLLQCQRVQSGILQTYRSDFSKYAKTSQHKYLQMLFDAAPRFVGQRLKYSNIDSDTRSRDLKMAMETLTMAGVIRPVYATHASGLPLGAEIDSKKLKLNFLDIGLMQNACGLQSTLALEKDIMQINRGAIAEQLAGQELRAYADRYSPANLFFWAREQKGSSAEVDYVINVGSDIIPIEVKAGHTGSLRSLRIFLEEKKAKFGVRLSMEKLSFYDKVLSVPIYMIERLSSLVESAT